MGKLKECGGVGVVGVGGRDEKAMYTYILKILKFTVFLTFRGT